MVKKVYTYTRVRPEVLSQSYYLSNITSRVSSGGNRIGAIYMSVWVCETYIVQHFVGTGLSGAPTTYIVHHRPACLPVFQQFPGGVSIIAKGLSGNAGAFSLVVIWEIKYQYRW